MKPPLLWSRLETAEDVTQPTIGPAGTIPGLSTSSTSVKFGSGRRVNSAARRAQWTNTGLKMSTEEGMIEFWLKPYWSDSTVQRFFIDRYSNETNLIRIGSDLSGSGKMEAFITGDYSTIRFLRFDAYWSAYQIIHVLYAWDRSGTKIGDSKTFVTYWDGAERASTTDSWTQNTNDVGLTLGSEKTGVFYADAAFDNLKVYDYVDLSVVDQRENERGSLDDISLVI